MRVLSEETHSCEDIVNYDVCGESADCVWCNGCVHESANSCISFKLSNFMIVISAIFLMSVVMTWLCSHKIRYYVEKKNQRKRTKKLNPFVWQSRACCQAETVKSNCPACRGTGCSTLDPNCSICLGDFERSEKLCRLPCNHIYHDPCINTWLDSGKNTCPLCVESVV
mmetsp:Transcript_17141/g.25370  ORF Transcript_17141/g.25370 Transcript_17141/m.25370 type:complete len:168 (+) Transcript_17141:44-547(+)